MPSRPVHTYCAMCVSRCGVLATVEDGRLTKVTADPEIVYSPDRLQYPLRRTRPKGERDPGWARISWDEAMALTASRLMDLKAGIQGGDWVTLETATGRIRLKARLKDSLHPQTVCTAHGWWQACRELGLPGYDPFGPEGANANLLVSNDVVDPISGSVPHRSQMCRVRKAGVSA